LTERKSDPDGFESKDAEGETGMGDPAPEAYY
jgi:hypothetical protein